MRQLGVGLVVEAQQRRGVVLALTFSFSLTCSVDRCVCWESSAFSCSEGYALYLCSYSQSRRIWTDSLGRLPLLLLLPEAAEEDRSRGISMLSSSSVSLPDAATRPAKGQGPRHWLTSRTTIPELSAYSIPCPCASGGRSSQPLPWGRHSTNGFSLRVFAVANWDETVFS